MTALTVVGIDFATKAAGTWAAFGQVNGSSELEITGIEPGITNQRLLEILEEGHAVVAIDVPFGWPERFVSFVSGYHAAKTGLAIADDKDFRYRSTDRFVQEKLPRLWPLSVSTDKIGMAAFRMTRLLVSLRSFNIPPLWQAHDCTTIIEVYPAATLEAMNLPRKGYKKRDKESAKVRREIIDRLGEHKVVFEGDAEAACREDDNALDASISALTAWLYLLGLTWAPTEVEDVSREGWIFFPTLDGAQ